MIVILPLNFCKTLYNNPCVTRCVMFGIVERVSHRKFLRQDKNRSLDLNVLVVSDVQLFLRVSEGSKPWNTHTLSEK